MLADLLARLTEYRGYADAAAQAGALVEVPGADLKDLLDRVALLCPERNGSGDSTGPDPWCGRCGGGGIVGVCGG